MMRLWLEKAGVFKQNSWRIDENAVKRLAGVNLEEFSVLSALSQEQKAFLRALVNTGVTAPQKSNELAKLAETVYGVRFPEKSLPKLVLNGLVDAGYITAEKTTAGRGAKPFMVAPTRKLLTEPGDPLLAQLEKLIDPRLPDLLRKPLGDILSDIKSGNRHISGLALEALAFKLMRLLDIDYVATRPGSRITGGAEVDLIFESDRLVFTRWQVQCKNTAHVALDDVAKEVGLTHLLHSNVIVIVTTGIIGREARRYADKIMKDSNLCIAMIDGEDLQALQDRPTYVADVFNREAKNAMTLKKLENYG